MSRHRDVSNSADIIDSRDVIGRINELEGELEDRHNEDREMFTTELAPADFEEYLRRLHDGGDDDATELFALRAFAEEASGVSDWLHGETFIRDSYFEEYARDLHEDINGRDAKSGWPYDYIDWERACDALKMDYSSYDYDGETYWARS